MASLILAKNITTGRTEAATKLQVDTSNGQLVSSTTTGTAPLSIASTTLNTNLNADLLDSQEGTYYLNFANHSIASEAQGDILYRDAAGWTRLAAGTNGQFLQTQGTGANPQWQTVSGTVPSSTQASSILRGNGAGGWVEETDFEVDASGNVVDGTWQADAVGAIYGGTGQTTVTTGDLLYGSASNVWSKLGIGTDGYFLKVVSGAPAWAAISELLPTGTVTSSTLRWDGSDWVESTKHLIGPNTDPTFTMKLDDNASAAFVVENDNGGADYISISTLDAGESMDLGNATSNPAISLLGTGQKTIAGNLDATGGVDVSGGDLTVGGNFAVGIDGIVDDGTWQADVIDEVYGGTGQSAVASGDILYGSAVNTWSRLTKGTDGQILQLASGLPAWVNYEALPADPGVDGAVLRWNDTSNDWEAETDFTIGSDGSFSAGAGNFDVNASGVVTDGTWQGDVVTTTYGGTGLSSYTAGDIVYYASGTAFSKLTLGTSGYFLSAGASAPTWAQVYWTLDGDSGGTRTIANTNTVDFVGGNGITTTTAAGFSLTIAADVYASGALTATGGGGAQLDVKANGIVESMVDWAATGATKIHSTNMPYDTAWTPTNLTIGTTYPTQDALKSVTDVFDAIDTAIGNVAAGLNFKGPVFSKYQFVTGTGISGTAIKQAQALTFTLGQPANNDTFTTYDGTTSRTYTAKSATPGANEFLIGASISATVQNLAAAIEADGSKIVRAQAANFPELDNTNNVLVLSGVSTLTTFRTWATIAAGGAAWTNQPYYITDFDGTSDDDVILPYADPTTSNFSTVIDQSVLIDGDTYVSRSCGCWERWDNTDNEWVTIMVSPSIQYAGGDGITIDTTKEPDEISIDLATNPGLTFSSGQLLVDLDGSTLQLTVNGLSIDLSHNNTWSGTQSFTDNPGIQTDTISEYTSDAGVTIDGLTIADGHVFGPAMAGGMFRTAGENLTNGQVVYVGTDTKMYKAGATTTAQCGKVYGIANESISTDATGMFYTSGFSYAGNVLLIGSLTVDEGDRIYVSYTAGSCTNDISGFGSGDWIQEIGVIVDVLSYNGTSNLYVRANINIKEAIEVV